MPIVWTLLPSTPLSESPISGACCDCCTNTLNLGCFSYCSSFNLKGVNALIQGYYSFVFQTPAGLRTIKVFLQIGENLVCEIPFEFGDSTFYILDPNGDRIQIQSVETIVDACDVPSDITTIYDCFRVTSKIESETTFENIPCAGMESVTIDKIVLMSRKNADRVQSVQIANFKLTTGNYEIYRLYYTPINGCLLAGDVSIVPSGIFTVSEIIHVVSDPNAPYIQFRLDSTGGVTALYPIALTISGLCDGCGLPIVLNSIVEVHDCGDPPDFEVFGLVVDSLVNSDPYDVEEDLEFQYFDLSVFRKCCLQPISVDIVIISSSSPDFTLPSTLAICATEADFSFRVDFPEGTFTAQVQFTLSSCSQTHILNQTFQRL